MLSTASATSCSGEWHAEMEAKKAHMVWAGFTQHGGYARLVLRGKKGSEELEALVAGSKSNFRPRRVGLGRPGGCEQKRDDGSVALSHFCDKKCDNAA